MSRKSAFLAIMIVLLLLGGAGTTLALLVRHEPAFYRRCSVRAGEHRVKCSGEFVGEFTTRLLGGILNHPQWDAQFTEEQINSYFEEDFVTKHSAENPLPEGISAPRIALGPEKVRLGFRYGKGWWSTVICIDLRVWLAAKEPNVVALEFESLSAGALPISAQSLLERVYEAARRQNIDPTWYRYRGHPVLLLRFQADRANPTFQLQRLELQEGKLLIAGRSLDIPSRSDLSATREHATP
jgi:hypothetical protein